MTGIASGTERLGGSAAVIAGLGTCLPPRAVSNDMLSQTLDTSDEWIRTRTGIRNRHVVDPGVATGDLAAEAGHRALESAGLPGVGVVIVATSTPDRPCPATAPYVATRLGLMDTAAFDVAAVCSGFVYALSVASAMTVSGLTDSALVIGADTFSTIMNPTDRATRVIFGDGAGAVVLRHGETHEDGALLGFDLGSDGSGADMVTVRAGGSRYPLTAEAQAAGDGYFSMRGTAAFTQAVLRMSESVRSVAKQVQWPLEHVDWLVPHQANQRILAAIRDQLGVPADRLVVDIDRVGNTVAASIPLALARAADDGQLRPGQRIVLTGFGGGLTWGSAALTWPTVSPR